MSRPDRSDLLERVKHILKRALEKFDEAEREREIIALLRSIEEILSRIEAGSNGVRETEIVTLLETQFRPIINGLKNLEGS